MKHRKLVWKLYPAFILTSLVSFLVVAIIAFISFRSFYYHQKETHLFSMADLVRKEITDLTNEKKYVGIQTFCKESENNSNIRLTVILPSGKVVGDCMKEPQKMDNHLNRPEVQKVFEGENKGSSVRYSQTLGMNFMYLAVPMISNNKKVGVLRVSQPLTEIHNALYKISYQFAVGLLIFVLLTSLISWPITRKLSNSLEKMRAQAENIADGDFYKKITFASSVPQEYFDLGNAINKITGQLTQHMNEILKSKNEQEAIFTSIDEGIVAVDNNEKVIHLNLAASKILGFEGVEEKNANIQDIFRTNELQELVYSSLKDSQFLKKEIVFQNGEEKVLIIQTSPMLSSKSKQIGVVIVITDYTKIRDLENHRRDFVANVSHELRTPLTTIQGFSETLLNPAVKDPQERDEFLKIISNNATRLGAIIEDLLALSSLEQESSEEEIEMLDSLIQPVIESAMQLCKPKAAKRDALFVLNFSDKNIKAKINVPLLEQAIVNLLDNAIKYGQEKGRITIEITTEKEIIAISVSDQGSGIPKEHIPRLFERFYRVDKARSRKLGGTGLGLSIVKHIALAHGGNVEVQSTLGKGSKFSIILPS